MAKSYLQKTSDGYWKGKCKFCGTDITRRTSLAIIEKEKPAKKGEKKIIQKKPRHCRDRAACASRQKG